MSSRPSSGRLDRRRRRGSIGDRCADCRRRGKRLIRRIAQWTRLLQGPMDGRGPGATAVLQVRGRFGANAFAACKELGRANASCAGIPAQGWVDNACTFIQVVRVCTDVRKRRRGERVCCGSCQAICRKETNRTLTRRECVCSRWGAPRRSAAPGWG